VHPAAATAAGLPETHAAPVVTNREKVGNTARVTNRHALVVRRTKHLAAARCTLL
jgi:hypothetical protein